MSEKKRSGSVRKLFKRLRSSFRIGKCISRTHHISTDSVYAADDAKVSKKSRQQRPYEQANPTITTATTVTVTDEPLPKNKPNAPKTVDRSVEHGVFTTTHVEKSQKYEKQTFVKEAAARNDSELQLQSVRQQLTSCLSRMRQMEEHIKLIPKLRDELTAEKAEKRSLQSKLKEIEECNAYSSVAERKSLRIELPSPPPPPAKTSTPLKCEERISSKLFNTQRVCATSLESLNVRFQNNSSPTFSILSQHSVNNSANSETPSPLKGSQSHSHSQRDAGCMTHSPITRDVGTTTQAAQRTRCSTTNTQQISQDIKQRLFSEDDVQAEVKRAINKLRDELANEPKAPKEHVYTERELKQEIEQAIRKHQNELKRSKLLNSVTIGTQCTPSVKQTRHIGTVTDRPKTPPPPPPCVQHSVGVMAIVDTRNAYCTAKPEAKSVSTDNMAAAIKTRSYGTDPVKELVDVPDGRRSASLERNENAISLKSLGMLQSSTLSLASDKDVPVPVPVPVKVPQNTASVQCTLLPLAPEPVPIVHRSTVATQHSPKQSSKSSQCIPKANTPPPDIIKKQYRTESTDTRDLVRIHDSASNTDAPPKTRDRLTNTERIRTATESTNTVALSRTVDTGTSPDPLITTAQEINLVELVGKSDIGCVTEPLETSNNNNSTTCIAKVEIKQQTLFKNPNKIDESHAQDSSRIPRPTALISPRSERKFTRQNTYTISPTSSPTGEADENIGSHTTVTNETMINDLIAESVSHAPCPAETLLRITSTSKEGSPSSVRHRKTTESTVTVQTNVTTETSTAGPSGTQKKVNGAPIRSEIRDNINQPSTSVAVPSASRPHQKANPSKEMQAALKVINDTLQKSNQVSTNLRNANKIVQKEWFRVSSTENAQPLDVEDYLDFFEEYSTNLLKYVVNLSDANGNTAMHYAISHGNFDVVSILLDSKVCCVNQTNNAGYTCVMLVSLAKLVSAEHHTVVQRLFQLSDVNIRAKKHNQTALMLAVSHGNYEMVQMLLEAGADINIQDEDGSTALMCAAEHGRIDIIKLLLAQPDCDSTIQDVDGSSALKISLEAGHRDIGVLLYAHEHMSRNKSPYASLRRSSRNKQKSSSLTSSTTTLEKGSGGGGSKQTP